MKGYRFYAEMPDQQRSKSGSKNQWAFNREFLHRVADTGMHNNCIALMLEDGRPMWNSAGDKMDAIVPAGLRSNSAVCSGQVDQGYLRKRCVRIDAELARQLHPCLFSLIGSP